MLSIWGKLKKAKTGKDKGDKMKAFLILEDGRVFTGKSIGSEKEVISEIVCNTSMSGYVEIMSDPSYAGQAVAMTYPLIGNYGVCYEDMESDKVWVDGLIVRELSRVSSNFRSEDTIQNFLEKNEVTGICGVDTRALMKHLRANGSMNGMITTNENYNMDEVLGKLKAYSTKDEVSKVTCFEKSVLPADGYKVALLDFGVKRSIARSLHNCGCEVTIYPSNSTAEEILASNPDGILLSNGPGNPKAYENIIEEIRKIYNSDVPVLGIGLGHQLMALAAGADTYKMKFGHRGANQPIRDLETGLVYITAQNHGYAVDAHSVKTEVAVPLFENVNDGTNEGLKYIGKPILTAQFYPEGSEKLQVTTQLFERFTKMMEEKKNA